MSVGTSVKNPLIRILLVAVLIAGYVFKEWSFAHLKQSYPNNDTFHSYIDLRLPNQANLLLFGEWVTTSATNDAIVLDRNTTLMGPVGNCIWLPFPPWLAAILLNAYGIAALILAVMLFGDLRRWRVRRRSRMNA